MRSYEAARSLFSFLAFVAWSVVVIGVLVALMSAAGGSQFGGSGAALLAMIPGIGIGITGFILVAFVQMGRATVDTAEYTQQMLQLSRDQLEVSKQGLKLKDAGPQTFAAAVPKSPEKISKFQGTGDQSPSFATGPNGVEKKSAPKQEFFYQKRQVRVQGEYFQCGGNLFETAESAKAHIDDVMADEHAGTALPLLEEKNTVSPVSSEPASVPVLAVNNQSVALGLKDGTLEYSGHEIAVQGGKFFFAKMGFDTLEKAQRYVDQLGVNPNAKLGGVTRGR